MYVPTFQGLTATDFVRGTAGLRSRYPFDVPHLSFYRARNAIYYLVLAMKTTNERLTVLAPDYNSGNEILAMRAAGATIRYYSVGRHGRTDPREVERLCAEHKPDVLYVIHYLGWPQPVQQLADLCRRRGMWLVEDCALALLSDTEDGRPLGSFGHWSIFCLYKTLPLPNGACLVQNDEHLASLDRISLRPVGLPSVVGRTADLIVRRVRSRADGLGAVMQSMKRVVGRAAGAMEVPRTALGDIGFNCDDVDLAMSPLSARLLERLDFESIRECRIANARRLVAQLDGRVTLLHRSIPDGVCPLFVPMLVQDKSRAAAALRERGVDALQFWNYGADDEASDGTRFLRASVLALPVHQDLTARHIDYMAERVCRLNMRLPS